MQLILLEHVKLDLLDHNHMDDSFKILQKKKERTVQALIDADIDNK